MSSNCYVVNAPRVIHQSEGGEVVAIDLGSGAYFSLRGPAAVIWDALGAGLTSTEVVDHIRSSHEATEADIAADVGAFVDDLVARELIVPGESAPTALSAPGEALPYETPVVEAFTDMADVILLDPVHDVDATAGWPHQPPADAAEGE
jgi:hypothetical protein